MTKSNLTFRLFFKGLREGFYLLLVICLVSSCTMPERSDEERKLVREEINKRQIKRVTESDLFNAVRQKGSNTIEGINNTILADLAENDSIYIADYINDLCDSLNNSGLSVMFYFAHNFDPDIPVSDEPVGDQLVSAYLYSDSLSLEMQENIQRQGRDSLIYMSPVTKSTELGTFIFEQHDDKSKLNTLAGVWQLKFAVKDIVLGIDQD